jgi:hypothetical protein
MTIDVKTYPMPERIAQLPRDPRGWPIFKTIQQANGHYNFLAVVPERVVECADGRLCGICGEPLSYWIHFVGGSLSVANRTFTEPPMHMECLSYAMAVCPFLAVPSYRRIENRPDRLPADEKMADPTGTPLEGERFAIYRTRDYKFGLDPNRVPVFLAAPAKAVIWRVKGEHHGDES